MHLDAIVTVVDAKNIQRQLQQSGADGAVNEAQKQIAYADSVLLNKVRQACHNQQHLLALGLLVPQGSVLLLHTALNCYSYSNML